MSVSPSGGGGGSGSAVLLFWLWKGRTIMKERDEIWGKEVVRMAYETRNYCAEGALGAR